MSNIKVITINPAIHQILVENKGDYLSMKEIKSRFVSITNIQINSDELTKVTRSILGINLRKHLNW